MKKSHCIQLVLIFGILLINNNFYIRNNEIFQPEKEISESKLQFPKKSDYSIIADHSIVNLIRNDQIPESAIISAKQSLHIVYGHTSHGSQVITGMTELPSFKESLGGSEGLYDWNDGPEEGSLDIDDYGISGDLGNPDRTTWADLTRIYLDEPSNADVNVVMWSWCGQVSDATETDIETYLDLMSSLEQDYLDVQFVYMTGHADGTGDKRNLHIRNQQIRDYCFDNNKILYDFYDIECYDLDGNYYGDKNVTDNCDYDSDGDGSRESNWALEWQDSHTEDEDWYDCTPAHTQALNGNQKAYAAWYLWVQLAGWREIEAPVLSSITPNPSNTGNIFLNWTEITDADYYTVYRYESPIVEANNSVMNLITVENLNYTDIISESLTVYYAVVSWNSLGTSKISNCVSISIVLDDSSTKAYLIVGFSLGSLALLGVGFIVYKKKKM